MLKWLSELLSRIFSRKDPVVPATPTGVGPPEGAAVASNNIEDVLWPDGTVKAGPDA